MQVHIKKTLQPFIDGDNILFGNGNAGLTRKIANTTENVNLIKYLAGEMDRKSLHLTDSSCSAVAATSTKSRCSVVTARLEC